MTTTELLLSAWVKDPFVICIGVLALIAYAVRVRGHLDRRAVFFALGAAVFVLALASPVGVLSRGYLFSAHMLQHLLLVLVVPPLMLLSLPRERAHANANANAKTNTDADGRASKAHPVRFVGMWIAGVGAMWLWHAPTLCDAAAQHLSVLRLQTVSLVVMGGAFWWPILASRASQRLAPFSGMGYLFTACIACTILGIMVTFSPVEVCSIYAHPVDQLGALPLIRQGWGLSPKADQEIGGLMMWVPGCMVYAGTIVTMYIRYSRQEHATEPGLVTATETAAEPATGPATEAAAETASATARMAGAEKETA